MATEPSGTKDAAPAQVNPAPAAAFWPVAWWGLMGRRIGIVPLPVYLGLLAVMAVLVRLHRAPSEICMVIAVITVGGFTCAEVGARLPILRNIGGAAICATFVPSCLVYYHLLPRPLIQPVADFFKSSNFLYLFITAIIVGSILGMDRKTLIAGFLKIFVPLAVGSLVAGLVGTAVGAALGLGARHTLFFTVIPIMAGGVGEGAIPLSMGYAERLHRGQSEMFAMVLPPVMLGSLMAILLAGLLNIVGRRFPHLTGEGRLYPVEHAGFEPEQTTSAGTNEAAPAPEATDDSISHSGGPKAKADGQGSGIVDVSEVGAAGIMAISLYLLGVLIHEWLGLPAPIAMLFLAVAAKVTRAIPPELERGAHTVYSFFRIAVVYPLLFAVGASITPWDKLVSAFHPANVVTIFATVASLMVTGFVVGRRLGMYPIEAAIINATHSGQGGTGDIAILTAANRMQLLPFAQVATRIGGAITVTLALIALSRMR